MDHERGDYEQQLIADLGDDYELIPMNTDNVREQARHKASVMIAFAEGKEIQYRKIGNQEWTNDHNPWFRWDIHEYRVKPEERKPLTANLWRHPNGKSLHYQPNNLDMESAARAGWTLVPVVEVLPSENTGGQL